MKAITQDAVVFSQDVNDPLSLVKQRGSAEIDSDRRHGEGRGDKDDCVQEGTRVRRLVAACAIATELAAA